VRIGHDGIELIKHFEGCRLEAYLCPGNVWTIGYGHTQGVMKGMKISEVRAEEMLRSDLLRYERAVGKHVIIPLWQCEIDALVSFVFNVGVRAFKNSTLLKHLNRGQRHLAAEEFQRWNKAGGVVLEGLVKRRQAEKQLFMRGEPHAYSSA